MNAAINCALANRQILAHIARDTIGRQFPRGALETLFDVSHNTCKAERHKVDGREKLLYVHRKGATRAFAPGHPGLRSLSRRRTAVIIGGSMGTAHTSSPARRRARTAHGVRPATAPAAR